IGLVAAGEPEHEEGGRPGLRENVVERLVDALHGRRHRHHHHHADRDAEDGQGGAHLVRAQRVERDGHTFAQRGHADGRAGTSDALRRTHGQAHSNLSAATGSSRDARLAGYTPKMTPTPTPSSTPSRMAPGVMDAGSEKAALT